MKNKQWSCMYEYLT